ncbi:MAG: tetratricopeptide repeat protein, partial [Acidobacteria bacterium]|nr:tetratricopeptide repeat protein [Acidobacteriota bacterium]
RWLKVWPFQKNTPDVVRSYSVMDGGSEPHLVEWSTFFGQMIRRQVIEHVHAPVWISSEGYDSCAQFLAERKADLVLETTFRQGPDQFWLLVRLFNGQEPQRTPLSLEFGLLENPVPSMEQALARIHDFLFPNNFEGGPKPITLLLTNSWPALQAYFRAQLAEQNGAIEDAESLFSESLANGPFSAAYLGLADCQLRLGKWKSALDATSAAFATRYKTASDHQRWSAEGQYFLATGQFENARAVYAKAVEAYPDLPHYREQLAQAFWGQTQYKLALGAFRAGGKYNLTDPNPTYPIYLAAAEAADEAWALATKWQVNVPQEPAYWFARGVTALVAKKYGDAADAFSAFRTECGYRGDPGGIFKAVFFRAKALACQGDLPGALEVLEAFLPQAYPELGAHVAQRNLARAALYLQLKKVSKARPLLEQLLDLDPIPAYLDCFLLASILCDRALSPDLFRQFGEKVQYIHEQYTSLHSSGARALADALRLLWNPHATEKPEVRQDIDDFLGEAVVGYPGPLSQYVLWQWNKRKDTSAVKALDARYWNEWRAPLLLQFFPYPFLAG